MSIHKSLVLPPLGNRLSHLLETVRSFSAHLDHLLLNDPSIVLDLHEITCKLAAGFSDVAKHHLRLELVPLFDLLS